MKRWSRPLLIGVLMLIFWTSACNYPGQTSTAPSATLIPTEEISNSTATGSISITETSTPLTPVIPITGENVVQMQCQFCVNGFAHVVFVFPDTAIFDIQTSSPVTCLTAEVVNGRRVLMCNGTQSTSFNLKICSDSSNCLLFPVALIPCPLAGTGTPFTTATAITPVFLTPINTLRSPSRTPAPKNTVASPVPTQTGIIPTLGTTATAPAATSTSAPPPPLTQPANTPGPTSAPVDSNRKPTHTPKP